MSKLIKLELQRIHLRTYVLSSAVMGVILLVFTYFIAYVAQAEQEAQFMAYENIFRLTGAVGILLFGVLSAAMYARLVIGAYSGKQLALLFSYPVSRKKVFLAKVLVVSLFVLLAMLACTAVPIAIFAATESFAPIVPDAMTGGVLIPVFKATAVSLLAVGAIGLVSMGLGFLKKSVPVTLISSFVLCGLYSSLSIRASESTAFSLVIAGVSLAAACFVVLALSHKIDHMEVD